MFPQYTENCPDGVFEMHFTVQKEQTDDMGRICPGDLARQMQRLTEAHFDHYLDSSMQELTASGLSWVIAWSENQIKRLPMEGEEICMRVWAGKPKSVMHVRKYAFYTKQGEALVTTASLFLLMDQKTRKAAASPEFFRKIPVTVLPEEPAVPKMTVKFPADYANSKNRMVKPEEIDYNGHLNNACYFDWTMDLPDESYRATHMPRYIWIEYTKELREGQSAQMKYDMCCNIMYVQGESEGTSSFRMKVEFD